jgi:hypothetical protein
MPHAIKASVRVGGAPLARRDGDKTDRPRRLSNRRASTDGHPTGAAKRLISK